MKSGTVTGEHLRALVLHASDVIGCDEEKAKGLLLALAGEAPGYGEFSQVDVSVVSEALRDASIAVPALRRGTVAALFARVSPEAPVCERCGRLPLRLDGGAWVAVTSGVCPVDEGLFGRVAGDEVVAWTDGETYPAGTAKDRNGVPITEAAIRAARAVHAWVDAAAKESGVTLAQMCLALVGSRNVASPVAALNALARPEEVFVDQNALRLFARGAGAWRRGPVAREAVDPRPLAGSVLASAGGFEDAASQRALRNAMSMLYTDTREAKRVARDAGLKVERIDFGGSPQTVWFNILNEANASRRVEALVDVARREYPNWFTASGALR